MTFGSLQRFPVVHGPWCSSLLISFDNESGLVCSWFQTPSAPAILACGNQLSRQERFREASSSPHLNDHARDITTPKGAKGRVISLGSLTRSSSPTMSNIDRYRPAREGYQPPSLPPKPPPTVLDRPSKSPSRRRDVPPAVPSPPAYSARTSPPRPQSRRSAPSPAHSSPQRAPQARLDQWFFTYDEVCSAPGIIDGLSLAEERLRRAKGVNFIYQAGVLLNLPQTTLWVAGVFFHRFYMRKSMVEEKGGIHHYVSPITSVSQQRQTTDEPQLQNIAATALFLANKTEENCRKTKDLIIAVAKVAQKNAKLIIDEQSKEYWRWRDSILTYEELMLETLTFDLMVSLPYNQLFQQLGVLELQQNKPIREAAWAFCNDACLTILPLLMTPHEIAVSTIFLASIVKNEKINDVRGEPWWRVAGGDESSIIQAATIMAEFYKENPLRKQDSKIPGSPEFNLESTRRRGDIDGSSHGGTPVVMDRGTQSPRGAPARTNGKQDAEDSADSVKKEDVPTIKTEDVTGNDLNSSTTNIEMVSQMSRGDSDAALKAAANDLSIHDDAFSGGGLRSPVLPGSKRKSVDMDADSDADREAKRARREVADEGEI